jgi:hypothetical protein
MALRPELEPKAVRREAQVEVLCEIDQEPIVQFGSHWLPNCATRQSPRDRGWKGFGSRPLPNLEQRKKSAREPWLSNL